MLLSLAAGLPKSIGERAPWEGVTGAEISSDIAMLIGVGGVEVMYSATSSTLGA